MSAKVYRGATPPSADHAYKLVLRPYAWKARMWRASDDSVQPMLRLDVQLSVQEVERAELRDLLMPFLPALREIRLYLQRGSATALPVSWSVGRFSVEHDSATAFLHRVLDDPFGPVLAAVLPAGGARADVTLSLSPYEIGRDRLVFAMTDYDIGAGADFGR